MKEAARALANSPGKMTEKIHIDPSLVSRAEEGKKWCENMRKRFEKQLKLVNSHNVLLAAVMTFYKVSGDESNEGRLERYKLLRDDEEGTKTTCWQVCMEAINRDFISFLGTGDYGNVTAHVYNALCNK